MSFGMKLSKSLLLVTMLSMSITVCASQNLSASIKTCAQQSDNKLRLACYDQLSQTLSIDKQAAVQTPKVEVEANDSQSKVIQEPSGSNVETHPSERFGLPAKAEPELEIEEIVTVVAKLDKNPYGKFYVTTDTGQLWLQIDSVRMSIREGDSIFIESGALGSYFMGREGISRKMRVKRIK